MTALPALLLAAALPVSPLPYPVGRSDPGRVTELVRAVATPGTAYPARRAAEAELKRHDPGLVLPRVAVELDRAARPSLIETFGGSGHGLEPYEPTPPDPGPLGGGGGLGGTGGLGGFGGFGRTPEADLPGVTQAARALRRVWEDHLSSELQVVSVPVRQRDGSTLRMLDLKDNRAPEKRAAVGAALVAVLRAGPSADTRRLAVKGLDRNYVPAAEPLLAAILASPRDPEQLDAAEILLDHHLKRYAAAVVDRVADPARPAESRRYYLETFRGGPFKEVGEADRRRLVRAGFALLAEDRAYHTAGDLESLLDQEFKPDRRLAKYQGPNGLTDAYFADTVTNALAWWAAHRKEYD